MENKIPDPYALFQKTLGYTFKNKNLLLRALTRQSAILERLQSPDIGHFQQLEFIGDKVLNLVMSDILQENNPVWTEGQLTQAVSTFVNNKGPLAKIAHAWNLGNLLIMGRGEAIHNEIRENSKVLSDAVEAIIGAIWLDSQHNYLQLKHFIAQHMQIVGLRHANYDELRQAAFNNSLTTFDDCYVKSYVDEALKAVIVDFLIEAIHEGQINNGTEFIALLLKKPLSQQALDAALIQSIGYYQIGTAKLLLKHGANPNAVDNEQYSALQLAIKYGYDEEITPQLIKLLLTYHADPNYKRGYVTRDKPASYGKITVKLFLSRKKEKEMINDNDTALHLLFDHHTTSRFSLAEILLKYNADPNAKNNTGKTLLHLVCELLLSENAQYAFIKILLKANIKANPNIQDNNGNTALHLLLETHKHMLFNTENFMEIIDLFIEAGTDLDKQNHDGNTLLHLASCNENEVDFSNQLNREYHPISVINRIELIEKLTACGANLTLKNKRGLTAFDYEKQIQVSTNTVTLLEEIGYFGGSKSTLTDSTQPNDNNIQFITENFKVII